MKLIDAILLSLAAGFVIIAIHQIMTAGFFAGYWAIMVSFILYFIYKYRKERSRKS